MNVEAGGGESEMAAAKRLLEAKPEGHAEMRKMTAKIRRGAAALLRQRCQRKATRASH
jgi:Na+/H+-translocating membrane pyrophosphatase